MNYTQYEAEDFLTDDSFLNYCAGSNDTDVRFWKDWQTLNPHKKKVFEEAVSLYGVLNGGWKMAELEDNFKVFEARLSKHVQGDVQHHLPGKEKPISTIRIWYAATAAVVLITLSTWLYHTVPHPEFISGSGHYTGDIKPGHNTATLTFSDGRIMQLSDAKTGVIVGADHLKYNDGSTVEQGDSESRTGSPPILTATTPRGGTYQVTLPDGTKVWLNAASSLEFPAQFTGKERRVKLVGEGYFEVAKHKMRPFLVESKNQQVEVLGTHFNINAYPDEKDTKTTLLEGSVAVRRKKALTQGSNPGIDQADVVLKPNQQATLRGNDQISVSAADIEEALSWKNGYFRFNNEPIQSVMQKISRWYNIEVRYEGKIPAEGMYGTISRFKNISEVLKMLEQTKGLHFEIEERRIIVKE